MTLKEKINADFMIAFKAKDMDRKNFLGVVKGEIQNEEGRKIGRTVSSDDMVITILRKMEKSLTQTNTPESLGELEYIKPYLPQLMSEDQIRVILGGYKSDGLNNMGALMGAFNKEHKGLANNSLVSAIIKEMLA
jgi:uncharacterized protein YqeY